MKVSSDTFHKFAERITEEMQEAGVLDKSQRMTVEIGSKSNGVAYRLYRVASEGGLSDSPLHLGDGFLGMTSNDAYRSLVCIMRTLEAVTMARR
jgi:hypothetical protein